MIRGQGTIKLYVVYNVLEVREYLLTMKRASQYSYNQLLFFLAASYYQVVHLIFNSDTEIYIIRGNGL